MVLAEATGENLSRARIDIYLQCLSDLDAVRLHAALESALMDCKWFPKIPEIRVMVLGSPKENAVVHDALADRAWNTVVLYCDRWHPDIGAYADAPRLTSREEYALRQVGGPLVVQEHFGANALQFIRRDFIGIWKRSEVTVNDTLVLGDGKESRDSDSAGLTKAFN